MTKTNQSGLSQAHVKKVASVNRLLVRVRNDATKNRITDVDFSFLGDWLGKFTSLVLDALAKYSRSYSSSTPIYSVRLILEFWKTYAHDGELPLFLNLEPISIERQISAMRYEFFLCQTSLGKSLSTSRSRWQSFLLFLDKMIECGVIPPIRVGSPSLMAPPWSETISSRDMAAVEQTPKAPKNLSYERDSYNDELFESLSITRSDDQYIDEFTHRLSYVIEKIKECALSDYKLLKDKREEGRFLLTQACADQLDRIGSCREKRCRYIDKSNKMHLLRPGGGHPQLLANLLYIVSKEMGGIPKPHFIFSSKGGLKGNSGNPHWNYISLYGKNDLLPYLGIMDNFALGCCMVLLLLELPGINATSLMRARLEDEKGRVVLLSSAGESSKASSRIVVGKPRAGVEKSATLTPLAEEVIESVLEWTRPLRDELIKLERVDDARKLWLGLSHIHYGILPYSQKAVFNALRLDGRYHSRGKRKNSSRSDSFLERHSCLSPWASKITYKALRTNVGVLEYLRAEGDMVAAARIFGHKKIETTIANYIPKPLRMALYERQVRRHQNRLIVTSLTNEHDMVVASDFKTLDELHVFLASQAMTGIDVPESENSSELVVVSKSKLASRIIINENPDAIAVAILYKQHLEKAPPGYIDVPDRATGVAPRFWIGFVSALLEPLPLAMSNITALVNRAIKRAEALKDYVFFPRF